MRDVRVDVLAERDLARTVRDVFSSALSTIAFCGGFRYRPTTSVTFAANSGSRLTLYVRTK